RSESGQREPVPRARAVAARRPRAALAGALQSTDGARGPGRTGATTAGAPTALGPSAAARCDRVPDRRRLDGGQAQRQEDARDRGHYSTTAGTHVRGHSLVQGLYVLLGRRCPLAPQLYQQQAVCQAAGVPFCSKLDLMVELVQRFVPVSGTRTHVLAASWYAAKRLWRAARDRGVLITTGLKANRSVRVPDATTERGWRWQRLDAYAAGLTADDFTRVDWPRQSE